VYSIPEHAERLRPDQRGNRRQFFQTVNTVNTCLPCQAGTWQVCRYFNNNAPDLVLMRSQAGTTQLELLIAKGDNHFLIDFTIHTNLTAQNYSAYIMCESSATVGHLPPDLYAVRETQTRSGNLVLDKASSSSQFMTVDSYTTFLQEDISGIYQMALKPNATEPSLFLIDFDLTTTAKVMITVTDPPGYTNWLVIPTSLNDTDQGDWVVVQEKDPASTLEMISLYWIKPDSSNNGKVRLLKVSETYP
jgi:hypothetical protein